jgi:hypothetical protein
MYRSQQNTVQTASHVCRTSVLIVLMLTLSLSPAIAGKPSRLKGYERADAVFRDSPGDAIVSDLSGPYFDGIDDLAIWADNPRSTFRVQTLVAGQRAIYVDMSNSLTGDTPTPFGESKAGFVDEFILGGGMLNGAPNPGPGETITPDTLSLWLYVDGVRWYLYFASSSALADKTTLTGADTDGDGVSDQFTFTVPATQVVDVYKDEWFTAKRKQEYLFHVYQGSISMAFEITFQQNGDVR